MAPPPRETPSGSASPQPLPSGERAQPIMPPDRQVEEPGGLLGRADPVDQDYIENG